LFRSFCHRAILNTNCAVTYNSGVKRGTLTVIGRSLVALATLAAVVFVYKHIPSTPTTVALTFLIMVLLTSAYWGFQVAIFVSVIAAAALNFYFLPPFGTFTIADPQNWIALLAFLVTALVASNLSDRIRREAEQAKEQRRNMERLYALSQLL